MTGYTVALIEDLHCSARAADIHLLAHQLIRRAVVVLVQFDVVVEVDARPLPLRIHEPPGWQRLQRRTIDQTIQLGSRAGHLAKGLLIQLVNQLQDGVIQLRQAEELPLAQCRQHPTLNDLNSKFRLGFVPGMIRPCRKYPHAIMDRQIAIGAIQFRLVVAGRLHARLQVVGHDKLGRSREELESPHMRVRPVPQVLRPRGFGVGVVAGPQHRHEHLRQTNFPRPGVRHRDRLSGVIDEHLFPGAVFLPQHHIQLPLPLAVKLAVPAVVVAQRMGLLVLLPQKLKGDILPALQFSVNRRAVGQATSLRRSHRRRVQALLQCHVIEIRRQGPAQPRRFQPFKTSLDGASAYLADRCDLARNKV